MTDADTRMASCSSLGVEILEDRIAWFGRFNGYEQLPRYLPPDCEHVVTRPRDGWLPRARGRWLSLRHRLGRGPQSLVDATARFARRLRLQPARVGHVLYGEHHLRYLHPIARDVLGRTMVTFHQPLPQWTADGLRALSRIPHRIVLCHSLLGQLPAPEGSTTQVILHGVDTDFFRPRGDGTQPQRRILYSGVHLRDLPMLVRVVRRLLAEDSRLEVDMLVPAALRVGVEFDALAHMDRVCWHAGLDEHRLASLYRDVRLMLLPMRDSGANTAIVEALASGLPVVTTDVGGVRDYGGATVYPVIAAGDDDAMIERTQRLLDDDGFWRAESERARSFALERLDWRLVARQHAAHYAVLRRGAAA